MTLEPAICKEGLHDYRIDNAGEEEIICIKCGHVNEAKTLENCRLNLAMLSESHYIENRAHLTPLGTSGPYVSPNSPGLLWKMKLLDAYSSSLYIHRHTAIEENAADGVKGNYKIHVDYSQDEAYRDVKILLHQYSVKLKIDVEAQIQLERDIRRQYNPAIEALSHTIVLKVLLDQCAHMLSKDNKRFLIQEISTWREKQRLASLPAYFKAVIEEKERKACALTTAKEATDSP